MDENDRYTSQVRDGNLLFRAAYELNAGIGSFRPEERMQISTEKR